MKGYLKAHRDHQTTIIPNNIITYTTDEKNKTPLTEFEKILSSSNGAWPTGVICYNDELAVKLLDIIRNRKLKVPEDISIVGFDDSFLANVSEVKLTTIEHPKSKLGEMAAKLILDLIKQSKNDQLKEHEKLESVVYDPKLIVRNSTAKLS